MEKKVTDFINNIALKKGISLDNGTDLFASGVFDSLEIITFLAYLETELNISFEPSDLAIENFQTVESILQWLTKNAYLK